MRIEDSDIHHLIKDVYIFDEGTYYFFDTFIVSEINQDIIYNWETAQNMIKSAIEFYGKDNLSSISYISNRINSYAVKPADWLKFFKSNLNMNAYAIVTYNNRSHINATLETYLWGSKNSSCFTDLSEAIRWVSPSLHFS